MIDHVHLKFLQWATWTLDPGPGGGNGGYGKNILQRIREGKGELLPGAPSSAPRKVDAGPVVLDVDKFVRGCVETRRRLIKVFYLSRTLSSAEKATRLGMGLRTMYEHVEVTHREFERWCRTRQ